jgi:hypothetical protein
MNSSASAPAALSLLFNWEAPRHRKLAITTFLALSLLAHAFCFYIFQIVYPPTVALLPPPARVSLISASSEEGRTLLRWVDAEDPALAFATQRPPEARLRALPKTSHIPSYLRSSPALKEIPPPVVDLAAPSSQPPGPVAMRHESTPATGIAPTAAFFSKELDAFGAPTSPAPDFAASNNEPPQAIRFRVAIGRLGDVRYCFAQNSSGDAALDEQARHYLTLCRFSGRLAGSGESDQSLRWGIATIEWGNDIARPKATSTKSGAK